MTGLVQKLAHTEEPAAVIWRELGNALDGFDIAAQGVLIAMYERPDDVKTQGGILLPHQHVKEDEFQGKVAMVLKLEAAPSSTTSMCSGTAIALSPATGSRCAPATACGCRSATSTAA